MFKSMDNAILLHGKPGRDEYYDVSVPSASNSHWFPWLQKQLLVNEIAAVTPEIPHAFSPQYDVWRREFERFDVGPNTSLVGHSCGGGFLVRWLSEHKDVEAKHVILVAPWLDPFRQDTTDFFEFEIDPNLAERTKSLVIFDSDNDGESVHTSIAKIRENIKDVEYRGFHNYGHFTLGSMGTTEFPELLEVLLT